MGNMFSSIVLIGVLVGAPQAPQTPIDPIKCWWKTDKSAVEVGEQFTLTLTCGVIETRGTTVVPKMDQLDPGALQLDPFEVVGGTRHDDIQAPPWRYFQYEYTVRLIGEDHFGEDVELPALTLTYNVQSGRDQMYVLPALNMRIMSLVPKKANDIRDSARESFQAATARSSRATAEFIAAGILFAFSVLMLAFAVAHVIGRRRNRAPVGTPAVSRAALMSACLHEIGRLQSEVKSAGWTPERAGCALAVLRIGGAVAIGRPVAQTPMENGSQAREGQLAVRKRILGRERIVVSASVTTDAIERFGINGNATIADLGKSLAAFSAVRYGQNGNLDPASLNRALENSRLALQRLRVATLWAIPRSLIWTR